MTYCNYWLNEVRIRDAVSLLQKLLNDEFRGTIPVPREWVSLIEDLIDAIYANDIFILDGLMRYEIKYELDEHGLIEEIKLVEKIF
jgi:hypothetical protein